MRVNRQLALRGHTKHVNNLEAARTRCVFNAHAYAERAGIELLAKALLDLGDLLRGSLLVGSWPALRQDSTFRQRRTEHKRPRGYVAGRRTVMYQRVIFF